MAALFRPTVAAGRRLPRPRRLLVLLVAVVALAGCRLDVTATVALQPDGTGQVTVVAVADAELLAQVPGVLGDLRLDDVRAAGWTVTGPEAADAGAQRLTLAKPFVTPAQAVSVLDELSGPGGPLRDLHLDLTRSFATVRAELRGTAGMDGLAALSDSQLLTALNGQVALADRVTGDIGEGLHLTLVAQLPGVVQSSNGTVSADEASVTWSPDLRAGTRTELQASFVQRDDKALDARSRAHWARVGLVVWAALAVVALVVGAVVVGRRRSRRRRRPAPSPFR